MKVNGKLSKEQIDLFVLEKYNNYIRLYIVSTLLMLLIFVPITLGFDNKLAFLAICILFAVLLIVFIFVIKYLKSKSYQKVKDNNKNYVFDFLDNKVSIKYENNLIEYEYDKIGLEIMKDFYVIEITKKEKYIIPKKNLTAEELKSIKKHFI